MKDTVHAFSILCLLLAIIILSYTAGSIHGYYKLKQEIFNAIHPTTHSR